MLERTVVARRADGEFPLQGQLDALRPEAVAFYTDEPEGSAAPISVCLFEYLNKLRDGWDTARANPFVPAPFVGEWPPNPKFRWRPTIYGARKSIKWGPRAFPGIYAIHARYGTLWLPLYVGQAQDPRDRLSQHYNGKGGAHDGIRAAEAHGGDLFVSVWGFRCGHELNVGEHDLINEFKPLLNRAAPPRNVRFECNCDFIEYPAEASHLHVKRPSEEAT